MNTGNQLQKSNILYLTSLCNLKCEYCYQAIDNEKFQCTDKDIENFISEICAREGLQTVSTVVLFGGEPLLYPQRFFRALELLEAKTQETGKQFAISTTTNGLAFLKPEILEKYNAVISQLQNHFTLEISYDGKGHDRRIYPNGKSSKTDTERVLELFNPKDITIRYTIHKGNYKCVFLDLVHLQKYKKVILNYYESELDLHTDVSALKAKIQRISEYFYTIYKTPICYANCELCKACNFGLFSGINYNGAISVDGNASGFNHFSQLKDLK